MLGDGIFQSVVVLQRYQGRLVARDPFSGKLLHYLSADEIKLAGKSEYAVWRYGQLPDKQLALTFDDGPDPIWTPKILDLLAKYHAQATFFLIGSSVAKYPEVANRIVREGHVIGNHTLTHPQISQIDAATMQRELVLTDHIIRAATNRATKFFRSPYGGNDDMDIRKDANALYEVQKDGYIPTAFDIDSNDWEFETIPLLPTPLVLDGKGHVVLFHDGGGDRAVTYKYLEQTLAHAKSMGYTFTSVRWIAPNPKQDFTVVSPSILDRVTFGVARGLFSWVQYLLTALFVIGIVGSVVQVGLNACLVLVHEFKRRHWSSLPQSSRLVTVAVAAWNEEKVIEKTILSLLKSDYPNIEIIAANDGSTDSTGEILDRLAQNDSRIRVLHLVNGGKSQALNQAFRIAKGDIVVTLDADTIFKQNTISCLVRHFGNSRVGAVAGQIRVGNVRGLLTAWQSLEYASSIGLERTSQSVTGTITVVPGACAAWRKKAVLKVGGYTGDTLAEDCDLTLKMQRLGYKIIQDNEAVAWTEAPEKLGPLLKQRFRWTFGNIQAFWKHRSMMFRPRHGLLGMVVLPYTFFSLAMPIIFLPLLYGALVVGLLNGGPYAKRVVLFAAIFTAAQLVSSLFGLLVSRAGLWHLLIVPLFRFINEPMRVYLLYRSFFAALKGRLHGWNRVERTGSVRANAGLG